MKQVIANIREGNAEKAELEISLISSPFTRCNALAKLAHFQIIDQNDLIAAKKTIEKLDLTIKDIQSKEDRLFSQVDLADLLHFIDKEQANQMIQKLEPEVWSLVNPEDRSLILIRMITMQLETEKDAPKAKTTIEQTIQTINFIHSPSIKQQRQKELDNVLFVNNHILCKTL